MTPPLEPVSPSSRTSWQQRLRSIAGDLAELCLPRRCLTCAGLMSRAQRGLACAACWSRLRPLPHPRCLRCGHPSHGGGACHWCRHLHPAVAVARSLCWASDPTGLALVHAMKYRGWSSVALELGARLAHLDLGAVSPDVTRVLLPVPLAPARLRERGYNQSEWLANGLAPRWCARVVTDLVCRVRETPSQTRLTPEQRLHNVANAFRVDASRVSSVGNIAYVLVDDVITTGATLNACAAALARAGARTICYITFGRARDPRDASPPRGTSSHGHSGRH